MPQRITYDDVGVGDWMVARTSRPCAWALDDVEPVDVHSTSGRRRVWNRATCWRGEIAGDEPDTYITILRDVAAWCGLRSAQAAHDALCMYVSYDMYGYSAVRPESARWLFSEMDWTTGDYDPFFQDSDWYNASSTYDDESGYDSDYDYFSWEVFFDEYVTAPLAGDPPRHPASCACSECDECGCGRLHCQRCHPDGPAAAGCECSACRPALAIDDQGDVDDWPGLPEIAAPDGRCRFGIEIEFDQGNRHDIMQMLQRAGICCLDTGYTHEVTRFWKMTTDATVTGGELVSPIMRGDDESIDLVRQAIRLVKEGGGVTSRNVGMHVHLDVTQFTTAQLKALVKNLQRTEMLLAGFVPSHRYDGSNGCGASLMQGSEWDALHEWVANVDAAERERSRHNREGSAPVTRYRSFNFNSLLTYGTVECRLLGHTLNTVKVRTWIRALQSIIEASRRRCAVPTNRTDILTWLTEFGLETEHADAFRAVVESRGMADHLVYAAA